MSDLLEPTERERLFDDEVAPLLLQAAKAAEKHGIALVCYAQWDSDGSGRTVTLPHNQWAGARIADYAAKAHGNVDLLIGALKRDGDKYGHTSCYLHLLGSNASGKGRA